MKSIKNRDMIIFLILIPVFLWVAFYISSRMENKLPAYSVINKSSMGSSVFYEALKELNFPTERSLKPVSQQDKDSVQIVPAGGSFNLNSEENKEWISKGGTLVHLAPENFRVVEFDLKPEVKGKVIVYKHGKGKVIGYDALQLTNKQLMKNTEGAYELLQEIGKQDNKKIYFNEAHLYTVAESKSLWDYVPLSIKFIIFQFILALAAFLYYKGKRFGKPIALYEEVERVENEYLYSASSLYTQAKAYDLMLENYFAKLLKEMRTNKEEWLEEWENQGYSHIERAKQVNNFIRSKGPKKKAKDYIKIITIIDKLTEIVMKRRDIYWKTLRK